MTVGELPERRAADESVDELYNESVLEANDNENDQLDIDEFLTQKASAKASHKRQKMVMQRMTQAATQAADVNDAVDDTKVSGVIKSVSLKNFMCHANFELQFGPRLNFIIGHNGSGKSAILTAISICLGAKATETNRGSNLRDLIREGQTWAQVQVVLSNEGDEAYEPGKYGSEITIERVIRKDASSFPYTLKSENGKKVSGKKGDLDAILDYFNIAVNNPMSFLSQDAARSFLTASTDDQKYKFFMKGTLMEEMLENFKKTREQVEGMDSKLLRMKDDVIALRDEARKARRLHEKLLSSNDLRVRQRILHGKYFWMEHDNATNIVQEIRQNTEDHKEVIEQLESKMREMEDEIKDFENKKSHFEHKKNEFSNQLNEIKEAYKTEKLETRKATNKAEAMVQKLNNCQAQIKEFTEKLESVGQAIRLEEEKIRKRNGGSKDLLEQQLQQFKSQGEDLDQQISQLKDQLENIDSANREEHDNLRREVDDKRQEIAGVNSYIKSLQSQGKVNPLTAFPEKVQNLVRESKRTQFQDKVLGPIATYVSVKPEYEEWAAALDCAVGLNANTFIVHNQSDLRKMQSLVKKYGSRTTVLVRKPEKFDYSSGRARGNFLTILDALEFSDEEIKYALIDLMHIESMILEKDRKRAHDILQKKDLNIVSTISLNSSSSAIRQFMTQSGGFRSDPLHYESLNSRKILVKNPVNDTRKYREQVVALEKEFETLNHQSRNLSDASRQQKQGITQQIKQLEKDSRINRDKSYQLQRKLTEETDTGKLQALQEEFEMVNTQKASYEGSLDEIRIDIQKYQTLASEHNEECQGYRDQIRGLQEILDQNQANIIELETEIQLNITKKDHFVKSKNRRCRELETLTENLPAWVEKIDESRSEAEKLCTREEADGIKIKTIDQLKREIEKVSQKVEEADQMLGKSPEEIVNEDVIARQKFSDAIAQFTDAKSGKDLLMSSLHQRLASFRESRGATCIEADLDFKSSLQFRNFTGNLEFDFHKEKLKMLVSTKNDKKPRHVDSLSGGEKSFSQIALLLATWKPMRSRIKGLDEFDVFMDQVNRKIGMRLMLSKLSSEAKAQTIFITPQDIGQIAELDERYVRIHRVKDPRSQVLN